MPFGTGARPRQKDPRDWKLGQAGAITVNLPAAIPDVFRPDISDIPVKMQGTYGTCGAHAGAMMQSIKSSREDQQLDDLSPKYLWRRIKDIDGFGLEDGTTMDAIFKALQSKGDCTEALLPNTLDSSIQAYSSPAITPNMDTSASFYEISNYAFTDNPSWDDICRAIYQYDAVIALVDIGDGWYANGWNKEAVCPLKLGNPVGHHFIVLTGYDQNYIYFRNSWSADWGDGGNSFFDRSYLPHVLELGTAVEKTTRIQLIILYRKLLTLLASLLSSKKGS